MGDKELSTPDKSLFAYLKMKQRSLATKLLKEEVWYHTLWQTTQDPQKLFHKKAQTYLGYSPRFVFPQGIELFRNSQFT